jgi:SAM-dependent methyltransferase
MIQQNPPPDTPPSSPPRAPADVRVLRPEGGDGGGEWAASRFGRWAGLRERRYFDRAVRRVFGYYALQLGTPQLPLLRRSPIAKRARLGEDASCEVRAAYSRLPIAGDCADLIILSHVLEFTADPHQVLREAVRALRPNGRLLIAGFNPLGFFGLRRLLRPRGYPWRGSFIAQSRLRDWLRLLNMEIDGGGFAAYLPPFGIAGDARRVFKWCGWMEKAGNRWWPAAGGVYFLSATKRIAEMRLLVPRWKTAPSPSPAADLASPRV